MKTTTPSHFRPGQRLASEIDAAYERGFWDGYKKGKAEGRTDNDPWYATGQPSPREHADGDWEGD